jgi:hypothetical protein
MSGNISSSICDLKDLIWKIKRFAKRETNIIGGNQI